MSWGGGWFVQWADDQSNSIAFPKNRPNFRNRSVNQRLLGVLISHPMPAHTWYLPIPSDIREIYLERLHDTDRIYRWHPGGSSIVIATKPNQSIAWAKGFVEPMSHVMSRETVRVSWVQFVDTLWYLSTSRGSAIKNRHSLEADILHVRYYT